MFDPPKKVETPLAHGDKNSQGAGQDAAGGLVNVVKQQKLPAYPASTIGKAFDEYTHFSKKEWKEAHSQNKNIYIDFIGWNNAKPFDTEMIKAGVSALGCEVKFVIKPDGGLFVGMVSRLEARSDGKVYVYPLEDAKGVLDKIYGNREIRF